MLIERMYARRLVIGPGKDDAPRPIGCSPRQRTSVVHEEGLCYEIDFLAGYSCGLFLDQRANRRRLRAANVENLLNIFAYTCSFSLAAAACGARTLSIDLSRARSNADAATSRSTDFHSKDIASSRTMPLTYCPGSPGVATNSMRLFWIRRLFQEDDAAASFARKAIMAASSKWRSIARLLAGSFFSRRIARPWTLRGCELLAPVMFRRL